jgi:hypothetical protein
LKAEVVDFVVEPFDLVGGFTYEGERFFSVGPPFFNFFLAFP